MRVGVAALCLCCSFRFLAERSSSLRRTYRTRASRDSLATISPNVVFGYVRVDDLAYVGSDEVGHGAEVLEVADDERLV